MCCARIPRLTSTAPKSISTAVSTFSPRRDNPHSSYLKDKLTSEMARLAQAMRVNGLRQGINLDGRWPYCPCFHELGNALHRPARPLHRRTQRDDVAARRFGRFDPGCNEGSATAGLKHDKGFLRHLAADGIEHGIATAHHAREILRAVVDHLVGAQVENIVRVRRARRRNHECAKMLGKLN